MTEGSPAMQNSSNASDPYRIVRIFVASPGDVKVEREQLPQVVDELNRTISSIVPDRRVHLDLVLWETDVTPGIGRDPQDVVNRQLGQYDIFVGIMWKRMGTPTAVARSGTEEEYRRAVERWQQNNSLEVMFYFCQEPFPPPRSREEVDQLGMVVDFRSEIAGTTLAWEYDSHEGFADVVRPHLSQALGRILSPRASVMQAAERIVENMPATEIAESRREITAVAREYEQLRAMMRGGVARTRRMEAVASKMRTLGLVGHHLLPELTTSESPGERLAAVSILQVAPDPAFIAWLGSRFAVERPFVNYQAALALRAAVGHLYASHQHELHEAIRQGKQALVDSWGGRAARRTNEYHVLERAEQELEQHATRSAEKR